MPRQSSVGPLTNALTDSNDLTATFSYNPAGQITQTVRTGDMYAFRGLANESTAYSSNGLNQITSVNAATIGWDFGNLGGEPVSNSTYGYSNEYLLTSANAPGYATLHYDAAKRLYQVAGTTTTRFAYDGADTIAEYNGSNALQRRFVFDPTTGQPAIWFEGTGVASTNRRYLSQDERGSVVSVSGSTGTSLGINTYDEFGKPGASNIGRFQYTGQKWIGEAKLYDYKARNYLPALGIFPQTDPIGHKGGANLYTYVGGDPVNRSDPSGLVFCTGSHINQTSCSNVVGLSCVGGCLSFLSPDQRASLALTERGGQVRGTPGHYVCVRGCHNSPSGGYGDDIFVFAPPKWEWQNANQTSVKVTDISTRNGSRPHYCGSGSVQVPDGNWSEACEAHDNCYGTYGPAFFHKFRCDIQLGSDIGNLCTIRAGLPAHDVCDTIGFAYWFGVTVGGWGFYRRAQPKGGGW